jgi:hypothetical protein
MRSEHNTKPVNWHLRFSLISGLFMVFVFITMGICLLTLPDFLPQARAPWRNYTGCLFLINMRYRNYSKETAANKHDLPE